MLLSVTRMSPLEWALRGRGLAGGRRGAQRHQQHPLPAMLLPPAARRCSAPMLAPGPPQAEVTAAALWLALDNKSYTAAYGARSLVQCVQSDCGSKGQDCKLLCWHTPLPGVAGVSGGTSSLGAPGLNFLNAAGRCTGRTARRTRPRPPAPPPPAAPPLSPLICAPAPTAMLKLGLLPAS